MTDYELEYSRNETACGEPFPEIVRFIKEYARPEAKVLDLGCGQGRDALMIAKMGHAVHGVDISPTGINQMLNRAQKGRLSVSGEIKDIEEIKIKEAYDIILIDRVIHMLKNESVKRDIIDRAKRSVSSGGYVLIVDIPSNIHIVEDSFKGDQDWKQVFQQKGFRFYRKAI